MSLTERYDLLDLCGDDGGDGFSFDDGSSAICSACSVSDARFFRRRVRDIEKPWINDVAFRLVFLDSGACTSLSDRWLCIR